MKMLLPLKIITFILLMAGGLYAQGTLRGVVSDSLSGDLLIGANVYLTGTSLGSATDFEGQYNIPRVPDGTYKAKVSYIGYKVKEFDVTITGGKIVHQNIQLMPDILEGEEVLVTGQAAGQMAAINQQRTSNTIINVVSEEKIKELPDANAAEAIGRLPGVSILRSGGEANKVILRGLEDKFTNITIDGVKIPPTDATGRGVDLSMLSQSSLAGIELFKALTPDKDGDALAGSVNLVTKAAPETRKIRVDLKGGYNDLENSAAQYDLSLNYGERFFDNILGVQLSGNLERKIRSSERTDLDYANTDRVDFFISDFNLEYQDEIRKRNGISLLLDIKTPDEGSIRINNVFGRTGRDYLVSSRDYPSTPGGGIGNDGRPTYDYRDREQEIKTFNSSIRGNNNLIGLALNWGLSFSQSDSYFPYDYELIFTEPNGMNATPEFQFGAEKLIPYAVNNFSSAPLQWSYYRTQDNLDKEKTAFLDISRQYTIGKLFSGELKAGGKYKVKDRSNEQSEDMVPYYLGKWKTHELLPDGTLRQKDFSGTVFEEWQKLGVLNIPVSWFMSGNDSRNVFDSYSLYPLIERDRLRLWWDLNRYGIDATGNNTELWHNPLIKYDDYYITERVTSGYIMNTFNVGQDLTVIAGVRIEYEDNDYKSVYFTERGQGFPVSDRILRDTTSSANQTVVMPNVNIAFRPYEFLTVRLAAYKSLARPDFNMRIDRYIAGRGAEATSSFVANVGNINLKTAEAWNYEVNTSIYTNDFGLISLSAYYKSIKDMYHMLNNFQTTGSAIMEKFGITWPNLMGTTAYNLTLPYNSPEPTKVWGFEFEHQMNFHFLPGILKNFVLSYNFSIVRSETVLYESRTITWIDSSGRFPVEKSQNILVTNKYSLERMPEFFGNISLGYDIGGFSGRISMFHKGKHSNSFSARGTGDSKNQEFTRFDLTLKQKVTDYLSLFLNVNNLTNAEDATVSYNRQYGRTLYNESEKYGMTADFGVTIEL